MMRRSLLRDPSLWFFAVLAIFPIAAAAFDQSYYLGFMSRVMVFGIAALGLNLVLGFGGMVSLGHAAFVGVGAYAVGLCMHHGVGNGWIHFGLAIGAGALSSLLIGALCLRTGGISFIMLTLAFAQLLFFLGLGLKQYGGDDGFSFRGHSEFFPWLQLGDERVMYWVILACLALSVLVVGRASRSGFGLALRGVKSNEERAQSIGLHTYRHKLAAFVLSGTVCALSGALLANLMQFVSPSYMHFSRSAELLLMILLGGISSLLGPLVGAAAFIVLEESLGQMTPHWQAPMGLALVLIVLFARNGLSELAGAVIARVKTMGGQ